MPVLWFLILYNLKDFNENLYFYGIAGGEIGEKFTDMIQSLTSISSKPSSLTHVTSLLIEQSRHTTVDSFI